MDKLPNNSSIQEQLNMVISMLKDHGELLSDTRKMLADSQAKVLALDTKVGTLEQKVVTLESELLSLKEVSNNREQASKLCSVRIHGFPVTDKELVATVRGKTLGSKVYERLIKPILAAASTKGDITSTRLWRTALESGG
jgi:hypothetical protein